MFLRVNLQDYSWGKKIQSWQMARTFQFLMISFLMHLLFSTVLHWHKPKNKNSPWLLLQDTWAHSRYKVKSCSANLLTCNFKRTERSSCARPGFVPWKKTPIEDRPVKISHGVEAFFLFFPLSLFLSKGEFETLWWMSIWGNIVLKILSSLKILGAFITALLKASFKRSINSTLPLCCCSVSEWAPFSYLNYHRSSKRVGQMGPRGERQFDQVTRTQWLTTLFMTHS